MRLATRTTQNIFDLTVLSLAYWVAFLLRFDADLSLQMWKRLLFTWPYVVGFELAVFHAFGVQRFSWRYIGLREAIRIGWATSTIATVLFALRLIAASSSARADYAQYALVPIGVIAANLVCSFIGVVGIRSIRRIGFERHSSQLLFQRSQEMLPTLLIGAGQAGVQVARELQKRPDLGLTPCGFLDDDRTKLGMTVHGIRVCGVIDDLVRLVPQLGVRQVIVTIAETDPQLMRRILSLCESAQIRAKIVPGLYQLIEGRSGLGQLRDVSIEDLLGRETVALDTDLIGAFLRDKRILVTGAGGSIGAEICRQVARFSPACIALLERCEFALFTIHQELLRTYPNLTVLPRLCDIGDPDRLETVFSADRPHVVFHAAAYKHVPMVECNPGEAIKNNVLGTKAVADAADRHGCQGFVLISTDKAVNPTSIMGATKRVAEMYIQALSGRSKTKYVAVRFGNVLGSTGSVIPIFKAQIAEGGPVTVTHPEMQRYFMTIPEASQLVTQAAAMGKGGEIFVLDMGAPVKIIDLANDLIRLSGLVPNIDIQIAFSGIRPGEKLFEEIGFDAERMLKTKHPKIFIGRLAPVESAALDGALLALQNHIASTSGLEVREALRQVVPEMAADGQEDTAANRGYPSTRRPLG